MILDIFERQVTRESFIYVYPSCLRASSYFEVIEHWKSPILIVDRLRGNAIKIPGLDYFGDEYHVGDYVFGQTNTIGQIEEFINEDDIFGDSAIVRWFSKNERPHCSQLAMNKLASMVKVDPTLAQQFILKAEF